MLTSLTSKETSLRGGWVRLVSGAGAGLTMDESFSPEKSLRLNLDRPEAASGTMEEVPWTELLIEVEKKWLRA